MSHIEANYITHMSMKVENGLVFSLRLWF